MTAQLSYYCGAVYYAGDLHTALPGKVLQNSLDGALPRTVCVAFVKSATEICVPFAYANVETCRVMIDLALNREYVIRELPLILWEPPRPDAVFGLFTCVAASSSEGRTRWYGVTLVRPVSDLPVGFSPDWAALEGNMLSFGVGEIKLAIIDLRR
jgi:hypothetical protein